MNGTTKQSELENPSNDIDLQDMEEEVSIIGKTSEDGELHSIALNKCSSCEKIFEIDMMCCRECSSQKQSPTNMLEENEPKQRNSGTKPACYCCCHGENSPQTTEVGCGDIFQVTSITSGCVTPSADKMCRICLDSVNESDLIAPCKCSGSTKYAHESCLLEWFFKSSKKSCEVCLSSVNVTSIGYKPVQQWRLPDQGCDFIVYLFGLYFLIMLIFTGMITWIATQGCLSPVCVTLYVVCAIALIYFFYCCGCVEYSRRYWRALLSVNRIWRIYGRDDSLKNLKFAITPIQKKRNNVGVATCKDNNNESLKNLKAFVIEVNECSSTASNTPANNNDGDSDNKTDVPTKGVDNHGVEYDDVGNDVSIIKLP